MGAELFGEMRFVNGFQDTQKLHIMLCLDDDGDFHDDQPLIQTDTYEGLSFRDAQMTALILDGNFSSKKCRRREMKSVKDYLRKWNQNRNKRNLQKLKTFVTK